MAMFPAFLDTCTLYGAYLCDSLLRLAEAGTYPPPWSRARTDSKHHVITEAHGIPLAVSLTGGQRNDVTQLMPLIAAIRPVRGRRGRPRAAPGGGPRRPGL